MNKIIYKITILFATLLLALSSCTESNTGFLDPDLSGDLTEEMVFSDSIYIYQYHTRLYRELGYTYFLDNSMYGGGYWGYEDIADGARCLWTGSSQIAHMWNMNTIQPSSARIKNTWNLSYATIVRVNIFLANIDRGPLTDATKQRLSAEARFIRAWNYFHLLRSFGGTPLLGDDIFGLTQHFDKPRATFAEEVDYILSECDAVYSMLPAKQTEHNYGRITSGAVLALKSKVLLLAASPIANGEVPTSSDALKPILGYENYDKNRWKLAADAAKAVMDLNRYDLIEDNTTAPGYGFYKMQIERVNNEYIFSLMKNNNRYSESLLLPRSRGGQVYSSPYQSVADAFLMKNGKPITDGTSGYNELKMYENRDPRFYYTLLYDGAMWIPSSGSAVKARVNFYKGAANDGIATSGSTATKTGYLWRKFCNENVSGSSGNSDAVFPIIRYAEILLNYAEALNEYDPTANKATIEAQIIKIRKRAGIEAGSDNRYGLPATYTQEDMRNIIKNERRTELALEEGHRYWDLRRWKDLAKYKDNVSYYAIEWTNPADGPQTFRLYVLDTFKFTERQYYFPIPQSEIDILGPELLPQNPQW